MISLQFITHQTERYTYLDSAMLALEGGCKWIQLRMKDASDEEVEAVARKLKTACREHGAILILDDRVHLAKKLETDGVHLGLKDMPIDEARRELGEAFIIGGTANTFEDAERHWRMGADYLGIGPFRFTETKQNLSPILGLEGYTSIINRMTEAGINLPTVAIGGVTYDDIPALLRTGVRGIAMSGAILHAPDPVAEVARILEAPITQRDDEANF